MTNNRVHAETKGELFRKLHHGEKMLLLPNVWDPISAALMEYCGFPAVSTCSTAMANAHGFPDGQRMPFEKVLDVLKRIVEAVDVPVSAEIGAGYADDPGLLRENISRILETGIAGINFGDSDFARHRMYPREEQCKRIALIRETADLAGKPLFINARVDELLYRNGMIDPSGMREIILRSQAYIGAGADGIFPVLIRERDDVQLILDNVHAPVNLIAIPDVQPLDELKEMGVARFSLGPGLMNLDPLNRHSLQNQL